MKEKEFLFTASDIFQIYNLRVTNKVKNLIIKKIIKYIYIHIYRTLFLSTC